MLSEILKAVLITSFAGACLAVVIALAKPVTKKLFSCAWQYYIWLAVLFVMVLPVRFHVPQKSDIPPVTAIQKAQTEQIAQAIQNTGNIAFDVPTAPETDIWQAGASFVKRSTSLSIAAYVWLTGVIVFLLVNLIGYTRLILKMRKHFVIVSCPELTNFTNKRVTVRVWENTSSPFMTGICRPTLVLPARELTEEQRMNILRHEMTHFKRHDIWYKWLVSLVKCVHWFNPVIWYVAKQIQTACEISCDMAVAQDMSKSEEMSYIDTVLSLLPTGKAKQIPLTTQMASSKKTLRRRFTMIRNKKKTSKIMSVISALAAVVMLSTTVFASGVLSDLAAEDYTVEITNNGKKIELVNKPFIENGEVYVPLREVFEKAGVMEHPDSYIHWDNGKITVFLGYDSTVMDDRFELEIDKKYLIYKPSHELPNGLAIRETEFAPILKNSITYVPYSYIDYMLNYEKWKIEYAVYDKNGNVYNSENLKNPQSTITSFFQTFSEGNFALMKNYCTEECRSTFFGDGYCFGMTRAEMTDMNIEPLEYAKSSNDFNVFVTVNMTPHEQSVFDPSQTTTSFYVILQRQPDGRYLIDEFATGL